MQENQKKGRAISAAVHRLGSNAHVEMTCFPDIASRLGCLPPCDLFLLSPWCRSHRKRRGVG